MEFYLFVMFVLLALASQARADLTSKEKKELRCAVCRAVVHEVNKKILAVNPKKTIEVGNYRIDGNGNQGTRSLLYARSEIHLTEVMEKICDTMDQYGMTTLKNGKKSVLSMQKQSDGSMHIQSIVLSQENSKSIRFMCDDTVSDHDEDIMAQYVSTQQPLDEMEQSICSESLAGYCTEEDLAEAFPNTDIQIEERPTDTDGDKEDKDDGDEDDYKSDDDDKSHDDDEDKDTSDENGEKINANVEHKTDRSEL